MAWEVQRDEKGNVVGLEIELFDEDPDGDEDRAGEGYYYRWSDQPEGGWSGAWHSEEEAEREAISERETNEWIAENHRDLVEMRDYLATVPDGDRLEVARFDDHPDSPAANPDDEQWGFYYRWDRSGPWSGPAESWTDAAKDAVQVRDAGLAEAPGLPTP